MIKEPAEHHFWSLSRCFNHGEENSDAPINQKENTTHLSAGQILQILLFTTCRMVFCLYMIKSRKENEAHSKPTRYQYQPGKA